MNSTSDNSVHSNLKERLMVGIWHRVSLPVVAAILALVIGAVILSFQGIHPLTAYGSLLKGAFGNLSAFTRTLEKATPLVLSGLAIAFGFKAGLFNIGAQGQLLFGAIVSAMVGFGVKGLPAFCHIPLALFSGALAGGVYAAIQGVLKARTGAHEVITGIMLNYVAINLTDYLSGGPLKDAASGNIIARTPLITETSRIPVVGGIPLGFLLAALGAVAVWWVIKKSTFGFEIRTVGLNPDAARYAGISVRRVLILTMTCSGLLAGLGGAIETQGIVHRFQPGFNVGLGFEGIAIALLARAHPIGVIPAALAVGAMKAGSSQMQFEAGVAPEITDVILALMLFFVAADMIVRWILRRRETLHEKLLLHSGWGQGENG
jgi:simple sugar transport system permease protein